jgi:cytochrome c oxidase subunit 4
VSDEHNHPRYGLIWLWLLILTVLEVGAGQLYRLRESFEGIGAIVLTLLVGMALVKAYLVAMYFMHLRFERKLFIVIVSAPPLVIATILVIGLMPDVGFKN